MTVPYRPLGHIREVVGALGLAVTYTFEDLVYVEHNAFLLRMGEPPEMVYLYFNTASNPQEREEITRKLQSAGHGCLIEIQRSGTYTMTPRPDEEQIEIAFHEGAL